MGSRCAAPPLTARFAAVIESPGCTPAQLVAILTALTADAGLTLTPEAECKAAGLLAQAEADHPSKNQLLQARPTHARRYTAQR